MRATWFTSLVGGILFGMAVRVFEVVELDGGFMLALFAIIVPVAVAGIPQLREMREERRRRGTLTLMRDGDLFAYYLPIWGRMALWFIGSIIAVLTLRRLGF